MPPVRVCGCRSVGSSAKRPAKRERAISVPNGRGSPDGLRTAETGRSGAVKGGEPVANVRGARLFAMPRPPPPGSLEGGRAAGGRHDARRCFDRLGQRDRRPDCLPSQSFVPRPCTLRDRHIFASWTRGATDIRCGVEERWQGLSRRPTESRPIQDIRRPPRIRRQHAL